MDESNNQTNQSADGMGSQVARDMQEFHNLHPNRKLTVFAVILFIFIVSIVVGMMLFSRNGDTQQGGNNVPAPTNEVMQQGESSLSLVSDVESVNVGEPVTVSVMLDGTPVQAADVVINFDSAIFEVLDVKEGVAHVNINQNKVGEGTMTISTSVDLSNPQDLKTGELFSFTLNTLSAGSGDLTIEKDSTITAKNGVNTLGTVEGTTITVK